MESDGGAIPGRLQQMTRPTRIGRGILRRGPNQSYQPDKDDATSAYTDDIQAVDYSLNLSPILWGRGELSLHL